MLVHQCISGPPSPARVLMSCCAACKLLPAASDMPVDWFGRVFKVERIPAGDKINMYTDRVQDSALRVTAMVVTTVGGMRCDSMWPESPGCRVCRQWRTEDSIGRRSRQANELPGYGSKRPASSASEQERSCTRLENLFLATLGIRIDPPRVLGTASASRLMTSLPLHKQHGELSAPPWSSTSPRRCARAFTAGRRSANGVADRSQYSVRRIPRRSLCPLTAAGFRKRPRWWS